ncbi:MAG: RHS repeat-associated core domain-containing protein [Pseudomonadota bacterium]
MKINILLALLVSFIFVNVSYAYDENTVAFTEKVFRWTYFDADGTICGGSNIVNNFSVCGCTYPDGRKVMTHYFSGSEYIKEYNCKEELIGISSTGKSAICYACKDTELHVCGHYIVNPDNAETFGGFCKNSGIPVEGQSCTWENRSNELVDVRTEEMIKEECEYPDLDFGRDEKDPKLRCNNISEKGNPTSIYSGNKIESERDLYFNSPFNNGLQFKRFYNSQNEAISPMGYGWTHNYNIILSEIPQTDPYIKRLVITDETGFGRHFRQIISSGSIRALFKERTSLSTGDGVYVWQHQDGSIYTFDESSFQLLSIQDSLGNSQIITYDTNNSKLIDTVTDESTGRSLKILYTNGLLSSIRLFLNGVDCGVQVTYGHDENSNLTMVTFTDGSGFVYEYNDNNNNSDVVPFINNLTQKTNAAGHFLSRWGYDDQDRCDFNETRDGRGMTMDYNTMSNAVILTDAYGTSKTYNFAYIGGRKRIISVFGDAGCSSCIDEPVRLEYDDQLNVIELEYANGQIDRFSDFDTRGNPCTTSQAVGTIDEKSIYQTWHPVLNRPLTRTEPSLLGSGNKVTVWDYDNDGNDIPNETPTRLVYRQIERGFTKGAAGQVVAYEAITSYTYNSKGQVLTIDGPAPGSQDTTIFTYDDASPASNLLTVTRPLAGTVVYANYDNAGRPGQITDENGNITVFTYDGLGRIKTVTNTSDGSVTTYNYNTAGEPEQIIAANGVATNFEYDAAYGRLTRMLDPLGNYMYYGYDTQGNRTEQSIYDSSAQRVFRQRYDYQSPQKPGKLWKVINPDNTYTEYSYFAGGNIESVKDPADKITNYDYDILNRLTSVIQPGDVITTYDYDLNNNLKTVTDAQSRITQYTYDDLGRLVSGVSPDTGVSTYVYDISGNLISKTDANGVTATYIYDILNRLTGIVYPDSAQNVTYTYDEGTNGKGRLTGMSDPSGNYDYAYDEKGNLASETKEIGARLYITSYTYDAAGNLTGMTYPDGRTVSYELDPAGRVNRVTTTKDGITRTLAENINYLPFGPFSGLSYGNGINQTRGFDQLYRLSDISAGSIYSVGFTKDAPGNITAINDNLDAAKNQIFGYDDLYRLTSATGAYDTIGYTYDKTGNRLTKTVGGQTDTYSYETGTSRLFQITGANPQSFTLDDNGNTTSIDSKSLTYNQNNRLIQASENSAVLANYTYNANGQRMIKQTDTGSVIYHYDSFGNLIGESTQSGDMIAEYIYLNGVRLAAVGSILSNEVAVYVNTSKGRNLGGVSVYAFTEAGAYTGKSAVTDENGKAAFNIADFADGNYKFRADYLSSQFWSGTITTPVSMSTTIQIAEETATLLITQGGVPEAGVKVYLFNESGAYLGIYKTTDENGNVYFDLPADRQFKFRADVLGSQFFSETVTIVAGGSNNFSVSTGGGVLTVIIDKGNGTPMPGISTYLFSEQGAYLGLGSQTDSDGQAGFSVPSGMYKIRADYLGYQFWTDAIYVSSDMSASLIIPHQDVTITANGDYNGYVVLKENLNTYLFTATGAYMGQSTKTDANGKVVYNLPDKEYKVRLDYLGQQFWSDVFVQTDQTVTIPECEAQITVTWLDDPLSEVPVYVFNAAGSYLGINGTTDAAGQAAFRLAAGEYNFRADYMGSQYFSGNTTMIADQLNPITISTGGGNFTLNVLKGTGEPMAGISCYLFTGDGVYLGHHSATNDQGEALFELPDGNYKIRMDYLGYQFWTFVFAVPDINTLTHNIGHQDVTITVNGDYNGDVVAFENINVYLFTAAGAYMNQQLVTDANGQVVFSLPAQDYKVRADYLGGQYWSDVVNQTDQTITINEGLAAVTVSQGITPIENIPVYVFSSTDSYLNISALTDENGVVNFILPTNTYKFRADYQSKEYWATEAVEAHQANDVVIDTGGGTFVLTVEKEPGSPIAGIPVYVFSSTGSYLGLTQQTDEDGRVSFDLSDGSYKFRADYMGYQFWSEIVVVPNMLSDVLTINHQDVTVVVNEVYQSTFTPLESIKVYLFTSSGAYQGINATTDSQGRVTFSLPQQDYKVRADYLGSQYWSEVFNSQNTAIDIGHGYASIHVTETGTDIYDAPVYLFTETGSYLGRVQRTDSSGMARFLIPAKVYKFRVDYNSTQYWSDVVNVLANEDTEVNLQLDLLAMNLTNDPNPVRFDGKPPEFKPEPLLLASLFDISGILSQSVVAIVTPIYDEKIYYYINDHLGTPQRIIDETGAVVWNADYQPFGEADVNVNSTVVNNFRLPGQYYDEETGLHYNFHRYYNPEVGRYLRADPGNLLFPEDMGVPFFVPLSLTIPQQYNNYTYSFDNPANYIDHDGLAVPLLLQCVYYGYRVYKTAKAAQGAACGTLAGVSYITCMRECVCGDKKKCEDDMAKMNTCRNKCSRVMVNNFVDCMSRNKSNQPNAGDVGGFSAGGGASGNW